MCGHGAGWALECPHPHPNPFKIAGNYPCSCPYPTMRVFTRPSWGFFAGVSLGPIAIPFGVGARGNVLVSHPQFGDDTLLVGNKSWASVRALNLFLIHLGVGD